MKTRITFQYQAPGQSKPDDITLTDVMSELSPGSSVPMPGDIVSMQVCWPEEDRNKFKAFRVLARHFMYTHEHVDVGGSDGIGKISDCQIFVVVTDADDDEPGVVIAE